MKRIIRLTERDLTRIVKRVLREEDSTKEEMCKSTGISAEDFTQKVINVCKSAGNSDCMKLGSKEMYPKTYAKLKENKGGISIEEYGSGCVEFEGNGIAFYENYNGFLKFLGPLGPSCGDKLITIPKVPQKVITFLKKEDYFSATWLVYNGSIYIYRFSGC